VGPGGAPGTLGFKRLWPMTAAIMVSTMAAGQLFAAMSATPRQWHKGRHRQRSKLGQKRSFNHLVDAQQEITVNTQSKRLGRSEIDHQFVSIWRLHWQVVGSLAF
jgi:hypothetical protein